jgi:hypothetical protein
VLYETPTCWDNFLMDFGLWSMRSEISNSFFSISIDGLPDLVTSDTEPVSWNFWISCRTALWCGTLVPGIVVEHLVYILHHTETHVPLATYAVQQITPLSQHTSFLATLLGSICLFGNRPPGPGVTRLILTPFVIPNSNYVIMVIETV